MIQPYSAGMIGDVPILVFVFGGAMWHFALSSGAAPDVLKANILRPGERLTVPTVDVLHVNPIKDYLERQFTAAEARDEP